MTPNDHSTDQEALSALFDGELHGETARFALRRLGHDAAWQDACGRWQMVGDVLRGQSTSAAPGDLARRVSAALVGEPTPALQAPAQQHRAGARRSWRGWAGGALAASVAAALFIARPLQQADAPARVVPAAARMAAAQPAAPPVPAVEESRPVAREFAAAVEPAPVAAPARQPVAATRLRATRATARLAAEAAQVAPAAARTAPAATPPVDPFRALAHGEIVTRPWPRAVLPGSSAAGALTASFGVPAESPSFYPFEPQLPAGHAQGAASGQQP